MKIRKFKEYSSINERVVELKKNRMIPLSEEEVKKEFPNGFVLGIDLTKNPIKNSYRI